MMIENPEFPIPGSSAHPSGGGRGEYPDGGSAAPVEAVQIDSLNGLDGSIDRGRPLVLPLIVYGGDDPMKLGLRPAVIRYADTPEGDRLHGAELWQFVIKAGDSLPDAVRRVKHLRAVLNGTGDEVDRDLATMSVWPVDEQPGWGSHD